MSNELPRTAAFVDYEYWYYSSLSHDIYPNIGIWMDDLKDRGVISEISFFGDFSKGDLFGEVRSIRPYTNRVIDTRNTGFFKKDYTDFIMLDHIYQKLISSNDIEQFVIVSGDGHFSSVSSYLRYNCDKIVGIYGVTGSISNQLIEISNWHVEMPFQHEVLHPYIVMLVDNFIALQSRPQIRPTFNATVETVARNRYADRAKLIDALSYLIDEGFVERVEAVSHRDSSAVFKYMEPNWELLRAKGYVQ